MKTNREKYHKYRELRKGFYARTMVPMPHTEGSRRMIASMNAMDATEDYLRFRAMNDDVPMPVKEGYVERVKRTRDLAIVNRHAEVLWNAHRKRFTFRGFLGEYLVMP